MAITVVCSCGRTCHARPEDAGKQARCPACKALLTIPAPETPMLPVNLDAAPAAEVKWSRRWPSKSVNLARGMLILIATLCALLFIAHPIDWANQKSSIDIKRNVATARGNAKELLEAEQEERELKQDDRFQTQTLAICFTLSMVGLACSWQPNVHESLC